MAPGCFCTTSWTDRACAFVLLNLASYGETFFSSCWMASNAGCGSLISVTTADRLSHDLVAAPPPAPAPACFRLSLRLHTCPSFLFSFPASSFL